MGKTRPPYAAASREQIIELFRSGRSQSELAREFSITPATMITEMVERISRVISHVSTAAASAKYTR